MQFITIEQYFYKLYNALLFILLVPIFGFIFVYFQPSAVNTIQESFHLRLQFSAIIVIDWLVMFYLYNKKIKSIRKGQGLRIKLEKYFDLTIVRFMIIISGSLILAVGFYFRRDDFITGLFALNLILAGILWPLPSKVCNDLKLKGDEREMVYYKKDYF